MKTIALVISTAIACMVAGADETATSNTIQSSFAPQPPLPVGLSFTIEREPYVLNVKDATAESVGQERRGFKIVKYVQKVERRQMQGREIEVDVSEVTIRKGERDIVLTKGRDFQFEDYPVVITIRPEGAVQRLHRGDTFLIRAEEFRLTGVDVADNMITLTRTKSHEDIRIKNEEVQQNAAPLPSAPQTVPSEGAR